MFVDQIRTRVARIGADDPAIDRGDAYERALRAAGHRSVDRLQPPRPRRESIQLQRPRHHQVPEQPHGAPAAQLRVAGAVTQGGDAAVLARYPVGVLVAGAAVPHPRSGVALDLHVQRIGPRAMSPQPAGARRGYSLRNALNRNLNVPCGWARNVISGPHSTRRALADPGLRDRDAAVEIVLAPRPAAAQRRRRIEPGDRRDAPGRARPGRGGTPGCCRSRRRPAPAAPRPAAASGPRARAGPIPGCSTPPRQRPVARRRPRDERAADRQAEVRGRAPSRCRSPRPCRRPRGTPAAAAPSLGGDASDAGAIRLRDGRGIEGAARERPAARLRDQVVGEDQDVVARVQAAGVEHRREHDLERELELFEQPADPARWHRAAVLVDQADARLATGRASPAGFVRDGRDGHAELRGGSSPATAPLRASTNHVPAPAACAGSATTARAGGEQPVDRPDGVVLGGRQQVPGGRWPAPAPRPSAR